MLLLNVISDWSRSFVFLNALIEVSARIPDIVCFAQTTLLNNALLVKRKGSSSIGNHIKMQHGTVPSDIYIVILRSWKSAKAWEDTSDFYCKYVLPRRFLFCGETGVIICRLRFQSMSRRLSSASGKCCYFMTANVTWSLDQESPQLTFGRTWRQRCHVSYVIFSLAASIYVDPPLKNNLVCTKRTCLHHMPDTDIFFEGKSDDFPKDVSRVEIGSCLADCFIYVAKLWIESGGFFICFAGRVITLTSWQDCTSETHCTKRTWSLTGVSLRTIFLEFSLSSPKWKL